MDVVTFGEAMAMLMADEAGPLQEAEHFTRSMAGAEMNTAIGLARLGLKSGWAGKLGEDAFGRFIIERLQTEKVDIRHVQIDPRFPTGFLLKSKVQHGDPEVHYYRKGSAASTLAPEDARSDYFLSAAHLHLTGITPALSSEARAFSRHILTLMKEAGKTVSFDPNLRPVLWNTEEEMVRTINELAFQSDYVLPGVKEGLILTGSSAPEEIADFYLEQGVRAVAVKLGAEGAFYKSNKEMGMAEGFEVSRVIDTVGAGDGFAAGFISGILEGLKLEECARRGNAIGALAVQSPGDSDGYPDKEKLEECMKRNEVKGGL
ncbi:sugar kinase [Bacillus mangrovi]|uniref:Sugar kinase n=1 Tax=Metabacillus mangrovi TaxID=1491830 RepID=A0A7X2S5A7_9BACI|nr:sugar kinase [Metabacillus mangrovi]MTH53486.1 sugar kinase [Metabacillus mangrovi]